MKHPVILDTDIGTDIDDTFALAYLLGCPELDLKLLTTVGGDAHYRACLAGKFLTLAGKGFIPIATGVSGSPPHLNFQAPWVGSFDADSYPGKIIPDAVDAIVDTVLQADETVTIIAIGAATNIAQALDKAPQLAENARFVGMFGSIDRGYDNADGPVIEANVRADPEAFRKVIAAPWREKIIAPLDTCGLISIKGDAYQKIFQSDMTLCRNLIENYQIWRELVTWMQVDYVEERTSTLFDSLAVYLAYDRCFVRVDTLPLLVSDDGFINVDEKGVPVQVALSWRDQQAFDAHHLSRILSAAENAEAILSQ